MRFFNLKSRLGQLDIKEKTVLVRCDLNVPFKGEHILDTTRIEYVKPTLAYLLKKGANIVVLSHLGRPHGYDEVLSLRSLQKSCSNLWQESVEFIEGFESHHLERIKSGTSSIYLLENVRFMKEEEEGSDAFARHLTSFVDFYVNEAFSCSHRPHSSIVAMTRYVPSTIGFLFQKECFFLNTILNSTKKPCVAIMGGSKVSTKIGVIHNLVKKVDSILLGGGMANTFLAMLGYDLGDSFYEKEFLGTLTQKERDVYCEYVRLKKIRLPHDVCVSRGGRAVYCRLDEIKPTDRIYDVGRDTLCSWFDEFLSKAELILWNGPLGFYEEEPFAKMTYQLVQHLSKLREDGVCVIGAGGDTIAAFHQSLRQKSAQLSYLSTSGGAFLEALEGKELAGITAILKSHEKYGFS